MLKKFKAKQNHWTLCKCVQKYKKYAKDNEVCKVQVCKVPENFHKCSGDYWEYWGWTGTGKYWECNRKKEEGWNLTS